MQGLGEAAKIARYDIRYKYGVELGSKKEREALYRQINLIQNSMIRSSDLSKHTQLQQILLGAKPGRPFSTKGESTWLSGSAGNHAFTSGSFTVNTR